MPSILYVGDMPENAKGPIEQYNRKNTPNDPLTVDHVPMVGFARATKDGLQSWLKGEIKDWLSQKSYDGILVDYLWRDLIPAIKEVHPDTPLVMFGYDGLTEGIEGIDAVVHIMDIKEIPKTLVELIEAKH